MCALLGVSRAFSSNYLLIVLKNTNVTGDTVIRVKKKKVYKNINWTSMMNGKGKNSTAGIQSVQSHKSERIT